MTPITVSIRVVSDDGRTRLEEVTRTDTGEVIGHNRVALLDQSEQADLNAVEQRRSEMRKLLGSVNPDPSSLAEVVAVMKDLAFSVLAISDVKAAREAAGEVTVEAVQVDVPPVKGGARA